MSSSVDTSSSSLCEGFRDVPVCFIDTADSLEGPALGVFAFVGLGGISSSEPSSSSSSIASRFRRLLTSVVLGVIAAGLLGDLDGDFKSEDLSLGVAIDIVRIDRYEPYCLNGVALVGDACERVCGCGVALGPA